MAAVGKRVWQLTAVGSFGVSKSILSSSFERAIFYPFHVSYARYFSQPVKSNGKSVDILALVKKLEGEGVSLKQAEAITASINEILKDSLENVQSTVSKGEMQRTGMIQGANASKFIEELQRSQERNVSLLQHETENLKNDMERMFGKLRDQRRAQLEAMKYDFIKYGIGALVLGSAVGLAVSSILM